jgi:hypothetical protein
MKIVAITKRMFLHERATADWGRHGAVSALGGPYADMLCTFADDDDPISLVAMVDDHPVGRINLLKGMLVLNGESIPVYWGCGLEVPPEQRTTGAALVLLARMRSMSPGTGAVSVSQLALPLYKKLGWIDIVAPRYVLPARPSTYLKHRFGRSVLVRAGGGAIDVAVSAYRLMWRSVLGVLHSKFVVTEISRFDETEHGPFEPDTLQPYRTGRSASWLNRIMSEGPKDNNRRLFLVRDRLQKVVGYFVTAVALRRNVDNNRFGDIEVATLRDWVAFERGGATESDVLALGLRQLLTVSCDVVELCVPTTQPSRLLRLMGMVRIGQLSFVLRVTPELMAKRPDLADPSKWWFRPGDGDAFLL